MIILKIQFTVMVLHTLQALRSRNLCVPNLGRAYLHPWYLSTLCTK